MTGRDELGGWCRTLALWAHGKGEIAELWLFGSRARGDHRHDSDLDLAVIMSAGEEGERLGAWIECAREWKAELATLLPVQVDLDIGDADIATTIVAPALKKDGRQIFRRNTEEA
ncbi:nucleotidyltransferase domain-containing protein [Bosea sp. CS1GBMeth4]|uniref:nucleotidyltransferase family protein n=1 Tax=Bosea sp. CS1GBMeth4 TaxID=1892849 RepID=UPI001644E867